MADARAGVGLLPRRAPAAPGRTRRAPAHLGATDARAAGRGFRGLRQAHLAGANPAQPRRGASVPLRLEPVYLVRVPARRPGQRRVGARARQGAARGVPVAAGAGGSAFPRARVRRPGRGDRRERPEALPGNGDREREPVPRLPRRRGRARRQRSQQARHGRARAPAAALRARRPPRAPAERRSRDGGRAALPLLAGARGHLRDERDARLHDAVRDRRAADARVARPAVVAAPAARPRAGRERHLHGDQAR